MFYQIESVEELCESVTTISFHWYTRANTENINKASKILSRCAAILAYQGAIEAQTGAQIRVVKRYMDAMSKTRTALDSYLTNSHLPTLLKALRDEEWASVGGFDLGRVKVSELVTEKYQLRAKLLFMATSTD